MDDKEIKEWQEKRKQEQIEKYGVDLSSIDISSNEQHRKKLELFSKIFSFSFKTFSIANMCIGITVVIFAFVFIYALFSILAPKNVLKSLKEEYRGEKFIVVEDFGAKNSSQRGLYLVSPKDEPNIIFKMYNTTKVRSDNDYSAHRVKYYFENCEDKELIQNFNIEEESVEYDGVEFLHYSILSSVDNYDEIEQKVRNAYKLKEYFLTKNSKMFEAIFIQNWDINYHFYIACDTQYTEEQEIYRAQYEFIKQAKEYNSTLLNQISESEMERIWKPETLSIMWNNTEVGKAKYDLANQEYYINDIDEILDSISEFEVTKRTKFPDKIKKIKYNNKVYEVSENETNKNNNLYEAIPLREFCEKLNFSENYDYNSGVVSIVNEN